MQENSAWSNKPRTCPIMKSTYTIVLKCKQHKTGFTRMKTIYINEKDETNTKREKSTALERSVAKRRLGVKPGLLAPNRITYLKVYL